MHSVRPSSRHCIACAAGSYEEREKVKAEEEREGRVEMLRRQIARRIMNAGIVKGFNVWVEAWQAEGEARRTLRQASLRLSRPALSHAYKWWMQDWQQAEARKAKKAASSLEREVYSLRHSFGKLELEKVAWADERAALLERIRVVSEDTLPEAIQAKQEAARRVIEVQQEKAALAEQLEQALRHGPGVVAAEKGRDEALAAMREQQQSFTAELERLLAEQRKQFESELPARLGQESREIAERCKGLEARVAEQGGTIEEGQAEVARLLGLLKAKEASSRIAGIASDASKPRSPHPGGGSGKGVLHNFCVDPESELSVSEQIANSLKENGSRVMDLFREWDTDGDGEVSRKEFHTAMTKLGLEVDKSEIDALFSAWDADGGGSLDFKELGKILRAPKKVGAKKK